MKDVKEITSTLSSMIQKGMEAQKNNWYGYFNHGGVIGVGNFCQSFFDYVQMSFTSMALANPERNVHVDCHIIPLETSSYKIQREKFVKSILTMTGARMIYSSNEHVFISWENSFVWVNNHFDSYVTINTISFDEKFVKQILDLSEKI